MMLPDFYEAIVQGILTNLDLDVGTLEQRAAAKEFPTERQQDRLMELSARIQNVVKIARDKCPPNPIT